MCESMKSGIVNMSEVEDTSSFPWETPEFIESQKNRKEAEGGSETESNTSDYPDMERDEEGFYSGKCDCGGTTMPMYDEKPFWIAFCNRCDKRWHNSESEPSL